VGSSPSRSVTVIDWSDLVTHRKVWSGYEPLFEEPASLDDRIRKLADDIAKNRALLEFIKRRQKV
jgi:hypothetical protein